MRLWEHCVDKSVTPTPEALALFQDRELFMAEMNRLEPICFGKEGFYDWTCCDAHIALKERSEGLRERGEAFGVPGAETEFSVLSARWWGKLGIEIQPPEWMYPKESSTSDTV